MGFSKKEFHRRPHQLDSKFYVTIFLKKVCMQVGWEEKKTKLKKKLKSNSDERMDMQSLNHYTLGQVGSTCRQSLSCGQDCDVLRSSLLPINHCMGGMCCRCVSV